MKLSIITPTLGNPLHLQRYFDSLIKQNFNGELEVLLCTTTSNAKEPFTIKTALPDRLKVRILSSSQPGIARARNQGLLSASGEYIFFLDDDCSLPNDNYITTAIDKLESTPNTGWAGGYIVTDASLGFASSFYNYISVLWLKSFLTSSRLQMIIGGCSLFHRQSLLKCGARFAENGEKAGEEILFSNKVTNNNIDIFFSDELNVFHNPRCDISSLLQKAWNHGRALGSMSKSTPQNRWSSYFNFFREYPLQSLRFFPLLLMFLGVGRLAFVCKKTSEVASTIRKPYLKRS